VRRGSPAGPVEPARVQARLLGPWNPCASDRQRARRTGEAGRASRLTCWARGTRARRTGSARVGQVKLGPWSPARRTGSARRIGEAGPGGALARRGLPAWARGALARRGWPAGPVERSRASNRQRARVGRVKLGPWSARASRLICWARGARARPTGEAGPLEPRASRLACWALEPPRASDRGNRARCSPRASDRQRARRTGET
jgi:hypothetical protein